MNGAESLTRSLLASGVDLCFANPGTSEMHFVSALDRVPGMRCVLGLFEGVVTGAADGYWRMTDRPAATLLHLGPGLANGLANLHNAKKAGSGIVNVVGDHATTHLALDAPLTSDIHTLAAPMSHWVQAADKANDVARLGREAVRQARGRPGQISTLILRADAAWSDVSSEVSSEFSSEVPSPLTSNVNTNHAADGVVPLAAPAALDMAAVDQAAQLLRADGAGTLLLLGDRALREGASTWAGRITAATGCGLMSAFYGARIERGAGRVALPRVPYAVDAALAVLARYRQVVLVGASAPVGFFAYPGKPGVLTAPGTQLLTLASTAHCPEQALEALCDALGARRSAPALMHAHVQSHGQADTTSIPLSDGNLDATSIGALLARHIPANAIVIDEAISTGRSLDNATRQAAPHDWLCGMGGAIGFGLPLAIGAAIGAPGRKVIALEGDGSAMYTPQALWTLAREQLDVTVVIFANRAYRILLGEFAGVGAGAPGQRAMDMLSIDRPTIDWLALAGAMGLPAQRASTVREFDRALARGLQSGGPNLVEVVL